MPQQYVEITKQDFEKFFKVRYRAYRPKEFIQERSEIVYDIPLSTNVVVRIYSSIAKGSNIGRGSGEDAIRALMFSVTVNRPINKKAGNSIVKRTNGWKDNLSDRIDSFVEEYHSHQDFYETIAEGKQLPPKQQPVKPAITDLRESRYDEAGNYFPSLEDAKKYNAALQALVDQHGQSLGGYGGFLLSLAQWIVNKKTWSKKQKENADNALKKFRITI